jgi:chloride channel protein, CIC family
MTHFRETALARREMQANSESDSGGIAKTTRSALRFSGRGWFRRRTRRIFRKARAGVIAMASGWSQFVRWFGTLKLSENTVLFAFAVAVGLGSAVGVVAFYWFIDLSYGVFYRLPAAWWPRRAFLVYRPVVTGAGFVVAWWIMKRLGRGHEGMNVPDVQLSVARHGGRLEFRPALARTLASAVTLGSGGSAGSEGPVAVLGSSIGSFLGRTFRFGPERVRVLVAAGAAAGISAAFNAPLTGAFFALEEILGSLAVAAFPAVVVSSVIGAVVSRAVFGNHPAFPIPIEYGYRYVREVALFFPLLGVVVGAVSAAFIRFHFAMEQRVARWRVHGAVLAAAGGFLVGTMVYLSGGTLVGYGHLAIRLELFGRMAWYSLALLALGKIVATSLTLNCGGSGGVFTPSLYLGAATGGAFGVAVAGLFPHLHLQPESYALVGMGAVVAASTGAPITGILIVFEMTQDTAIMLPLMLTTVIGYAVTRVFAYDNLYSGWLRRRGVRIGHGSDQKLLARYTVQDAFDPRAEAVAEEADVPELIRHLHEARASQLPVVAPDRTFLGMVTLQDLGRVASDAHLFGPLVRAADLATESESVTRSDTLQVALRKLGARGAEVLPVVDAEGRLEGVLTRAHILGLYERSIAEGEGSH